MSTSYAVSAWIFARALGLVYFVAFLSLANEGRGLWGSRGVLPIAEYLSAVEAQSGPSRFWQLPSVFWFSAADGWIVSVAVVGAVAAILAAAGAATGPMLLVCLLLYLSFVSAGQEFMSFQWDILLIEVGFVSLFAVPWSLGWTFFAAPEPHWAVRGAICFVLFKLMFLSGVVKILSGDPSWRDFTALGYHYWTQPLPNPLSAAAHAGPMWMHKLATFGTFVVELGLTFLMIAPRTRIVAALGFAALSLFIALTGNYTFFNYLTIALATWLVPDAWWFGLADRLGLEVVAAPDLPNVFTALVMGVLTIANVYWCTRYWLPRPMYAVLSPIAESLRAVNVSSSYGLFATMTKTRPEISIEGSVDGEHWIEYEFKYKPGPVTRRPPVVAPLQPRLDWQMWFAALGSYRSNPFVGALMMRLFEDSPDVLSFFVTNPFPNEPPRFLRARLYDYEFGAPAEIWSKGEWWARRPAGDYSPTFRR